MTKKCHASQSGFSLAEVMTVVSIIVILSVIAMPRMMTWYLNASLQTASRDLYSTLKLAQANAARRNRNCVVAFNQNDGYTAYVDINKNFKHDPGEPVLLSRAWSVYSSVRIPGGGITYPKNRENLPAIGFRPSALPVAYDGKVPNGSVTLISTTGRSFTVSSNITGNITIKK